MTNLDDEQCKKLIFRVAMRCGVSPRLITTKLLSEQDKQDMRNGELPQEALTNHVEAFRDAGLPNRRAGEM